jgi:hypothetical protein
MRADIEESGGAELDEIIAFAAVDENAMDFSRLEVELLSIEANDRAGGKTDGLRIGV